MNGGRAASTPSRVAHRRCSNGSALRVRRLRLVRMRCTVCLAFAGILSQLDIIPIIYRRFCHGGVGGLGAADRPRKRDPETAGVQVCGECYRPGARDEDPARCALQERVPAALPELDRR